MERGWNAWDQDRAISIRMIASRSACAFLGRLSERVAQQTAPVREVPREGERISSKCEEEQSRIQTTSLLEKRTDPMVRSYSHQTEREWWGVWQVDRPGSAGPGCTR